MDPATGSRSVVLKLAHAALSVSVVFVGMREVDVHLVQVIQRSSPAGELDAVTTDGTCPLGRSRATCCSTGTTSCPYIGV